MRDGVYRSQFETGTSNGGLTAHPGGNRWLWEERLFGGAYNDAPVSERPKYGALNHRRRSLGGAPGAPGTRAALRVCRCADVPSALRFAPCSRQSQPARATAYPFAQIAITHATLP